MKKTFFFLYFLALPFLLNGQTKTFTIPWESNASSNFAPAKKSSGISLKEKALEALSLQIDNENLSYKTQWRDVGFADENSITLANVAYAPLSSEELKRINPSLVPDRLTYSIASTMGRDVLYTLLTVSPVVRSNGSYQKVLSFSVNYRMKTANRNGGMRLPITNSVLATGEWFKFKIDATGIYKIDKAFLNSLGMDTDGIDPRNLKVYGNGGKPLPLLNALNTVFDLPQTSIQVVGEADGSFDSGDHIIFYGIGTRGYSPENDTNINPYSDDSFYYVTADGGPGNRVQPMTQPTGNATITISQFDDYKFHELDEESPTKLGRRWFGNRFDIESEQSYEFIFPNIVAGQPMNLKVKAAAISETATSMALSINGTSLDPLNFAAIGEGIITFDNFEGEIPAGSETVTLDLAYNNSGNPSSVAYLDYISIEAVRNLTGADNQMAFRYNDAQNLSGIGEYQLSNASGFTQVWDVTNPAFISSVQNEGNGASIGFKATLGELREYVAVHQTNFFSPIKLAQSRVQNQNLKGTIFNDESGNFQDIDYLIITAPFLLQPALRLANHHKTLNGLNVKVVTTDKIYEEFSSGKQDIGAIRNFVRYVYENASSENNRVKYLGILGDTSVDYKDRLAGNNNIVPSFHTLSVDDTVESFVSDDFFGNLDFDEGTIGVESGGVPQNGMDDDIDILDVAIGRIIADDVMMANAMVDKIVHYTSKESYGNWRTNFILISDDPDDSGDEQLQVRLDTLGDLISAEKPFVNVKKIHSDAYLQQTSAGGNIYPDVNEAIKNAVDVGAVIMNYFGHGNEDGLAGERIFTKAMAAEFQNKNNLPCIVTITCQFTKFDNPLRITGGELTFQNKEGGAISLVATTRSISISLGQTFNELMADELFGFGVNVPETPAEGLRRAKNDITNYRRRVVFYIGDPALRLAFPKQEIRLTALNGVPISQATDTLKALSKVKLEGEIVNQNGTPISNYNGVLEAKLYDKNVQRQTLRNDGVGDIMTFTTLGEGLFNGQATVANGRFEFEFVVPRDIQIPVGNGRLSLYAQKNDDFEDHTGVNLDLKVGGLNENAPADNTGPLIRLFMNDESFVSGGLTNDSPILIAKLEDTNGINTASGIGHDIVAILDGDESNPFLLNEYYQAEVDDYTKGTANYNFRDLEDGLHTLTLKAWDVYNNSSTAEIQFIVAGNDKLEINQVLNYPNPFVNYTEFWFSHNREFQELEVQVQVFTVTGKVVWTKSGIYPPNGSNLFREIVWDGRDDFGDRIGKGVYVYKITVKSPLTNHRVEKFEKLVIL